MRINDAVATGVSGLGQPNPVPPEAPASRERTAASDAAVLDRLQLSNLSSRLSVGRSDSSERGARVSQLSALVSAGRYQVDAQAVAGKLIEEHLNA